MLSTKWAEKAISTSEKCKNSRNSSKLREERACPSKRLLLECSETTRERRPRCKNSKASLMKSKKKSMTWLTNSKKLQRLSKCLRQITSISKTNSITFITLLSISTTSVNKSKPWSVKSQKSTETLLTLTLRSEAQRVKPTTRRDSSRKSKERPLNLLEKAEEANTWERTPAQWTATALKRRRTTW